MEPYWYYAPGIANLPETISVERLEEARLDRYRKVVKSLDDQTPVPPPKTMTPERFLQREALKFAFREPKTKEEIKIARWHLGYGYLISHSVQDKKYRVDFEHFFNIPHSYWSGIVLSVAKERDTHRAIYGLRRDATTEFPFNPRGPGPTRGPFVRGGPLDQHLII